MKRVVPVIVLALVAVLCIAGAASAATTVIPVGGCATYNGVIFCYTDQQSVGTGVYDPFLRTNAGGNHPDSQGWNTDANIANTNSSPNGSGQNPLNFADDSWTSALLTSSIGLTAGSEIGDGVPGSNGDPTLTYRTFSVDINQQGNPNDPTAHLIYLDQFILWNCTTATYTALTGAQGCVSFLNLFGATGDRVEMDYLNGPGSGGGDVFVYVPNSGFTGPYTALLDGWLNDNDGFQEWARLLGDTPEIVQEPGSLLLMGCGLVFLSRRLRRKVAH